MPANGSGLFSTKGPLKPHLMQQSGGIAAEVNDVRKDLKDTLGPMAAIAIDEFTNPAAAGAADLEAATATTVAPRTVTTFLAGGIAKLAAFPRNITFTTAGGTPADAPATALVTGTYRGKPQTETVTLAQTATIANGVKPFSTITSVAYAAADGTNATVSIGVGISLGSSQIPLSRAGLVAPVREIAIGAAVTTGTLTVEGLYTPSAAPNGTNDYAIFYEFNPTV
jgi:hypothetical protein